MKITVNVQTIRIMGDFNAPNIDWNDLTCSSNSSSFAHEFVDSALLTQHVSEPTFNIPGQKPSILDLVFTSDPNPVDGIQHQFPLGYSDHECIFFKLQCSTKKPKQAAIYIYKAEKLSVCPSDRLQCSHSI